MTQPAKCPICDTEFPYIYRGQGNAYAKCPCGRYKLFQNLYNCTFTIDKEEFVYSTAPDCFEPREERDANNKAVDERLKAAIVVAREELETRTI